MDKASLTYAIVKAAVENAGYKFFTGELNINMIGIRSSKHEVDNWDDFFILCWQENGENLVWVNDRYTTDPGIYYMQQQILSPKGCGILVPGQYRGVWKIGHHGAAQYEAFVQIGNTVKVYRDRNKDNVMDFDSATIEEGWFGCNQHHGYESAHVGNNSAMCQVHQHKKDLDFVLSKAKQNIAAGNGDSFTYTLLTEKDFN